MILLVLIVKLITFFFFLPRSFLKHSVEVVYMLECKRVSVVLQGNITF